MGLIGLWNLLQLVPIDGVVDCVEPGLGCEGLLGVQIEGAPRKFHLEVLCRCTRDLLCLGEINDSLLLPPGFISVVRDLVVGIKHKKAVLPCEKTNISFLLEEAAQFLWLDQRICWLHCR